MLNAGQAGLQQLPKFHVPAVPANVEEAVANHQTEGIRPAFEQKSSHFQSVFAHGEVNRRPVRMLTAYESGLFLRESSDLIQVSRNTGAEHRPHVGAPSRGPLERLVLFQ